MKDHTGMKRQYIICDEAWYIRANPQIENTVTFGLYDPEGGTTGEMEVEWSQIGDDSKLTAQLKVFEDSWSALASFSDVIEKLGEVDSENIQIPQFIEILNQCGFEDNTTRENPYKKFPEL